MLVERRPAWVAAGILTPVVLCGGLTWLASETMFPQLAVLVAYPPALAAGVAALGLRGHARPPRGDAAPDSPPHP